MPESPDFIGPIQMVKARRQVDDNGDRVYAGTEHWVTPEQKRKWDLELVVCGARLVNEVERLRERFEDVDYYY